MVVARCPHSLLTSSSARSVHSEDFYGLALVTRTQRLCWLKSANVYLFWLLSRWDWQARSQLRFLLPVGPRLYLPRRQSDGDRGSPLAPSRRPAATPAPLPAQSKTRGSQVAAGSSVSLPPLLGLPPLLPAKCLPAGSTIVKTFLRCVCHFPTAVPLCGGCRSWVAGFH